MSKLKGLMVLNALLFVASVIMAGMSIATVSAQEIIEDSQDQSQDQKQEQEEAATESQNQENGEQADNEDQNQEGDDQTEDTDETYNYTAQPGDSYTLMSRKAVQTYGINNEVNLNPAQIIFVETNLTQQADSPYLLVGEDVSIDKQSVVDWVEKAQDLSDEEKNDWAVYTDSVDFNTNNVGESS